MEKKEIKTLVRRFSDRKSAAEFAKQHNSKVERCPVSETNRDGYFKYQVHIEK